MAGRGFCPRGKSTVGLAPSNLTLAWQTFHDHHDDLQRDSCRSIVGGHQPHWLWASSFNRTSHLGVVMQDTQHAESTAIQHQIMSGPDKDEFIAGLSENTASTPRTVRFILASGLSVDVSLDEVGRESGDGHSWLFKGRGLSERNPVAEGGCRHPLVEGYYHSRTHRGWLKRSTR